MSDFKQAAIDAILEDLDFDSVKELRAYVSKNKQDDYFYGGVLHAINAVQDLSSAQPVARDTNVLSNDTVSRQSVIDALCKRCDLAADEDEPCTEKCNDIKILERLTSAQPEPSEITDEQAILHLQSTGWMQNHDREMYESGLREQLADDSGSYDSLIPSGDTILRQDAIDATWEEPTYTDPINVLTEVRDRIKALPSAQPETSILTVTVSPDSEEIERVVRKIKDAPVMQLPSAQPEQKGWVCPVCGRGLSPLTMVCPCNNGKRVGDYMQDLISRQAAIDVLDVLCQEHRYRIPGKRETYSEYNEAWQDALDRAEGAIGNLPSAQPEIIRCKDCKYADDDGVCQNSVGLAIQDDDDFCSRAERRTDG